MPHQIALAALRNGDDPSGCRSGPIKHQPGVYARRRAGQILGEKQVNHVVDRDDHGAGGDPGNHIVRNVEQMQTVPPRLPVQRKLLANGVCRCGLLYPSHVPGGFQRWRIGVRMVGDQVQRTARPGQMGDELTQIGADPVIVQLAGIDAHADRCAHYSAFGAIRAFLHHGQKFINPFSDRLK